MNATVFARTGIRARATIGATPMRSAHFANTGGKNVPFSTKNRTALAIKVTLYLGIPFAAAFLPGEWQKYKASRG
ncbi:cytochrome c oxidase subunit VIIc [Dissophora ornata]|nr:cytochrome c oxidase subunit VIIc [Dissophora ornata]